MQFFYNAPGHPEGLSSDDKQIVAMFLPPNVTPLMQPMDQNVIVSSESGDISAELKKKNLEHVQDELRSSSDETDADVEPQCIYHREAVKCFEICRKWALENSESII